MIIILCRFSRIAAHPRGGTSHPRGGVHPGGPPSTARGPAAGTRRPSCRCGSASKRSRRDSKLCCSPSALRSFASWKRFPYSLMSVGFCHFLKLCHLLQECRWCRRLGEAEGWSPPSPRLQEESSSHNQNLRQRRLLRKNSTPHRSPWGPDQAAANAGPTGGHARRVTNPLSSVGSGEAASEKIKCCSAEINICFTLLEIGKT